MTGVRRSEALLATSREAPDAGTDATALLRRAGLIRDFGSGLYGFLPTGERVLRKVRARIEAAMDAVGAQRVGLPALQYSGDWRASGRWESFEDEMFTLENRDGQAMCLAPSHEEGAVRLLDGVVRSHDDLPLVVYQVGEKYRVLGTADLFDLAYVVPEVLIPVIGVFLGVIALAATVIGYVYTPVSRLERAAFALSSFLLMAPGLGVRGALDVLGVIGIGSGGGGEVSLAVDLALRGVGLALFVALLLGNRGQGASGFFGSSEAESSPETA